MQLGGAVNVVVTCTKSKRGTVAPERRLRAVPSGPLRQRAKDWIDRLRDQRTALVEVTDLYSGDHWSTVRSLRSPCLEIDLWVCSAGYGLVHLKDHIAPYSATFSRNHPDSVFCNVSDPDAEDVAPLWWSAISKWKGPTRGNPRTIEELAVRHPRTPILVVASESYLNAIASDLRDARSRLADSESLSIISAGTKCLDGLDQHLVPCDARFQTTVGGARRSLNIRLVKKILAEARTPPRASNLKRKLQNLSKSLPEIQVHDRTPLLDSRICSFIRKELRRDQSQRHTPLLRKLRQSGYACEQSRFKALYRKVQEETDAI